MTATRNHIDPPVHPAQPRTTAQVKFADGRSYEAPVWTQLEEYIHAAGTRQALALPDRRRADRRRAARADLSHREGCRGDAAGHGRPRRQPHLSPLAHLPAGGRGPGSFSPTPGCTWITRSPSAATSARWRAGRRSPRRSWQQIEAAHARDRRGRRAASARNACRWPRRSSCSAGAATTTWCGC